MTDQSPRKPPKPSEVVPSQNHYIASLPANIVVQPLVWLRHLTPRAYVPNLLSAVFFFAVLLLVHPTAPNQAQGLFILCVILAPLSALSVLNPISLERRRFSGGCLCPAIVVSVNPPLIAVSTDLSKIEGAKYPAIKILPQPLQAMRGAQSQVGDRLPAAALYQAGSKARVSIRQATGLSLGINDKPYWDDFSPMAVQSVTDNPTVIQDALRRLSESGDVWDELQTGLAQIPQPYRPGLYRGHG